MCISHDMIINTIVSPGILGAATVAQDFMLVLANAMYYHNKIIAFVKNAHKIYPL